MPTAPVAAQQAGTRAGGNAPVLSRPAQIESRVGALLSQMTLEEKINLISGTGMGTRPLPRLQIPALKMTDGPLGVRIPPSTAYAAGIGLAATWNPALAEEVGRQIGRDARARGAHFLLGPGVNIYRSPRNGRNFEYFGEDPFLGAQIAVGYIQGIQREGVSATVKHFLGNNSEFARNSSDSVIDERTLREIYLPIFEAAVKQAHVGAMMDSYNLVNGAYMTQNGYFNTDVAKGQWNFDGVMMSDWFATHDALGAANGGMDLEMPFGLNWNQATLLPAIRQGQVTTATIDDKVRRILRVMARFGWLDRDQTDPAVPLYNQQGRQAALEGARQSLTLLKNDGNLLPLDRRRVKSIAVIGPNGFPAVATAGGSGNVPPYAASSLLTGLSDALGTSARVTYARGLPTLAQIARSTPFTTDPQGKTPGLTVETFPNGDATGTPTGTRTENVLSFGRSFFAGINDEAEGGGGPPPSQTPFQPSSTRWTAYYTARTAGSQTLFVESADNYRVFVDDKPVLDGSQNISAMVSQVEILMQPGPHKVVFEQYKRAPFGSPFARLGIAVPSALIEPSVKTLAAGADAVVVAVGFNAETETEGSDREFRLPPGQEELIRTVAAANPHTIVVVTSGGSVNAAPWLDQVSGLVEVWYPGQEGGRALAETLLGDSNPSGRLPISWERQAEDNPAAANYDTAPGTNRIAYREGVFVGYRGYERNRVKPLFPFGYGLSYTTFRYGKLAINPLSSGTATGGPSYAVSFDVTNTGKRAGADVAQVYIADGHAAAPRPPKELKGFARVELRPGQTRRVTVALPPRAFTYYDVNAKVWCADPGDFEVLVGRSSEQIELRGKIVLSQPVSIPVAP